MKVGIYLSQEEAIELYKTLHESEQGAIVERDFAGGLCWPSDDEGLSKLCKRVEVLSSLRVLASDAGLAFDEEAEADGGAKQ